VKSLILLTLFWIAFTALFALMQGFLIPTLRRTPPSKEAKLHDLALHKIGFIVWLLPVLFIPVWWHLGIALLVRVVFFDIALNIGAGDPVFNVGRTAKTDKLLQKIASFFGITPDTLSAVIKMLFFVVLCVIVYIFN
jgi:hypothetical protein